MPDIYRYTNISSFLADHLSEAKTKNSRYSLRAWSKQIGHKNPSLLSEVLKGKRSISFDLSRSLLKHLSLSASERRYFKLLVLKSKSKNQEETSIYDDLIQAWNNGKVERQIELDQYHLVADWYHSAILEMFSLANFKLDYVEMARRLGNTLTPASVEQAIMRLLRLDLLSQDADGNIIRNSQQHVHAGTNVASEALRRHHHQMLEKAMQAIEEQNVGVRHLSGTTLSIRSQDYHEVTSLIETFHTQIQTFAVAENADDVYRFNTQFFNLTCGAKKNHNSRGTKS